MKKLLYIPGFIFIIFTSCNKEPRPLTTQQIKQKVDSVVMAHKKESDEQARVDLERRIKIEVKVKVDSILNARKNKTKKDTLTRKPLLK